MLICKQTRGVLMLYGYPQNSKTLVIAAADSYDEMLEFSNMLCQLPGSRQTSFMDHLKSEFKDYQKPVFIIPFVNDKHMHQWCEGRVELVSTRRCVEIHRAMVKDILSENQDNDEKPLEEVFNLKNNDPWDKRSDEEKQNQLRTQTINKKISDQIQKNITGSSFGANKSSENKSFQSKNTQKHSKKNTRVSNTNTTTPENNINEIETLEDLFNLAKVCEIDIDSSNNLLLLDPSSKIENLTSEQQQMVVDVLNEIKIKTVAKHITEQFKGSDYIYAWNDMLSENPAVGGKWPVFEIQSVVDNNYVGDLNEILNAIDNRLESVSIGIFIFRGSRDECDTILQKHGFKQVPKITHKSNRSKQMSNDIEITPRDFARALAGDGTSTMSITGSWGKEKVGKTVDDYDLENAFEVNIDKLVLTKINRNQLASPHNTCLEHFGVNLDIYSVEITVPIKTILLKSKEQIVVLSVENIQHHRKVKTGHMVMGHKNGSSIFLNSDKKFVEIKFKHV